MSKKNEYRYDIGCDCNVSGKDHSTEYVYGMI